MSDKGDKGDKPPKGKGPSGVHTQGGGGDLVHPNPSGVHTQGGGGDVVNQQRLVLDPSIFQDLSTSELHALKIVQLEFAQAVSLAAAAAYEKLIAEFRAEFRRAPVQPVMKPEKNLPA